MNDIKRRIENLELALFGTTGAVWHETGELSDGAMIGRIGSLTHIIDPETKTPMSAGYHEITVDIPSFRYIGKVGSSKEYIYLRMDRRTMNNG